MTERKRNLLALAGLLAVLLIYFAKILFTHQIIRAPDITNEFYWTVRHFKDMGFFDLFRTHLQAGWDMYANSGGTEGGGTLSLQFLYYRNLLFWLIPAPANVAWFIVFHLFVGGAGTYCYCRLIGCSRTAAFLGGLLFAIVPENASLINAGHAQKIATISFAPWAFYFLEKGFICRRVIWFLTAGFVLAFQFFNMHWQIAFYTCIGIGVYGVGRSVGILIAERQRSPGQVGRLVGLNLVTMFFFLSTVAISLIPLADWSKDTTRGVQSGANQGQGGLNLEEAMSWSMPPEELVTFVVPGMFGFSRQEGGYNTGDIDAYYWGRMVFTQTIDYMGLLPWLLLPLPLIFRRDRYTWLALAGVVGGILFSMGKYTPFYWFLFEHFPGVNHFRVPKMMMFIPALGLGVLAARGLDILRDGGVRGTRAFQRYMVAVLALPALLLVMVAVEMVGRDFWLSRFMDAFAQPTRYEQGPQLVMNRWNNLVRETAIAAVVAALHAAVLFGLARKWFSMRVVLPALFLLFLADTGRVNAKFMLLQDLPPSLRGTKTPVMEYLARDSKAYRVLPMNGRDPMHYASNGIPVMFTSNPVMVQRWQDFLDGFTFDSAMLDLLNVKYLIYDKAQYEKEKDKLGGRFTPVFTSPDGVEVVVENRTVLPKAWLVPAVLVTNEPRQQLGLLRSPLFDPRRLALVESQPSLPLADPMASGSGNVGEVTVGTYEANRITLTCQVTRNSLLVMGEKYYKGWRARVDGKPAEIQRVDYILRGVYLAPGTHTVEFTFDPLPFKVGKYLTLASFAFFAFMVAREWRNRRKVNGER
ncbi:YfhO family protein [Geomobilimonas luticola]|uniref:YfhO family protein n=1 Tax=Geomobilimonas luticola TaxID=1114878 RepID=A0ABS5SEJ2_9BACT|nr:YfhO family protein [Geomobilimonas luticola]MBT0653796.1 YfhO family protein [Geomobilimonas luticola]